MSRARRTILLCLLLGCTLLSKAQVNTDHMMRVGRNALYFSDYVLSIQYFNQVVNAKPYLYEPYFFRGLAKYYLDDFTGAEADCTEAISRNPFVVDCHQLRGLVRVNQGKYAEAIGDYRNALRHAPGNEELWYNLALCYANLKSYDEAIGVLDTIVSIVPGYAPAWKMRAQVHIQRKDTTAALADLKTSLQINKYDSEAYATRALVYLQQEDYESAEADLTYAIHLNPKSNYYINRALTRYHRGELRGAMNDYDLAIDLEPNNVLGRYNRGLLRAQVGDDNRAIEDFNVVIEYEPDNTMATFNRALLLTQTGDLEGAEDDLDRVLKEYPQFLYGYQCRASVRRQQGKLKEAEEDELIVLRAQMEEQNQLLAGKTPNPKNDIENEDENNTRKKTDKNIKKYHRLVVADDSMSENEFSSSYRGKVQNRNVYVTLQPLFTLTYYNKESEVGRIIHYHHYLESIKRTGKLPLPLLVTASEQPLNKEQIDYHFKDIDQQTHQFASEDEDEAIHYFARGLDFYLVQDLEGAINDFTQAIIADGTLWLSYYSRAVVRYKQMEMQRAIGESRVEFSSPSDFMVDTRLNEYQIILADFNKAIDLAPDFAYTYYNRGYVLSQLKDYHAAIESYNEAIALEPNLAEAYYNRGLTYIYLGENARGVADLSKAGELGLYSAYNLIKRFAE